MTPGAHPLEELAVRVGMESGVAAGLLLDDWRADPNRLRLGLRQVPAKAPATRLFTPLFFQILLHKLVTNLVASIKRMHVSQ